MCRAGPVRRSVCPDGSRARYWRTQNPYTARIATAPTIEIVFRWWLAGSLAESASRTSTMMKLVISSSVAVSLGSLGSKRIVPLGSARAPTMITSPSTSSALTRIEPRIAVSATIRSPAMRANRTTKNSGRLPSVACSRPVTAGPKRWPTCSVANDTIHAPPASARPAMTNATTEETPPA